MRSAEAKQGDETEIRVGLVGAGQMGRLHARTVASLAARGSGFRLAWILDRHRGRATSLATEFGANSSGDLDAFSKQVEVAIVAVPTGAHHDVSMALLERDIDVLIEKPMAATISEAESLVRVAQSTQRIVQVGHVEWYNPAWRVAATRAGVLRQIDVERLQPPSERGLDIDVIQDLMLHDLDWTTRWIGTKVLEVEATGNGSQEVDAKLHFEGGCVVRLRSSRIHSERLREVRFKGDAGKTTANLDDDMFRISDSNSAGSIVGPARDPLEAQWIDFIAACREGVEPESSGRVGVEVLRLIERVREAVDRDARRLNVDDDSRLRG